MCKDRYTVIRYMYVYIYIYIHILVLVAQAVTRLLLHY